MGYYCLLELVEFPDADGAVDGLVLLVLFVDEGVEEGEALRVKIGVLGGGG